MTEKIRYRVSGQAGYEIACAGEDKTRVVFALFDEEKTKLAWYLFSSALGSRAQGRCAKDKSPASEQFAHHDIPASNPNTFRKKIALDALVSHKSGAAANLNIDAGKRMVNFDISQLKTTAGEVVEFGATAQIDRAPANAGVDIKGKVYFLELVDFDEQAFKLGPQEKSSIAAIFGSTF